MTRGFSRYKDTAPPCCSQAPTAQTVSRAEGYALEMPHDPTAVSLTFIGTATTSMRVGAFNVLSDPNFLRPVARGETTRLAEEGTVST